MIILSITFFISIILLFKSYTYSITSDFVNNSKFIVSENKEYITPVEGFMNIRTKHIISLLDNINVKLPTFISNKKKAISDYSDIEGFALRLYILMLFGNKNFKIDNSQKKLLSESRMLLLESFQKVN